MTPGTRGTLMVNIAVFPKPPSSRALPGTDSNHSPGTLQAGTRLTYHGEGGVYQGHRFVHVGIAPTTPLGAPAMDTGNAPPSGWIVDDPGNVYWDHSADTHAAGQPHVNLLGNVGAAAGAAPSAAQHASAHQALTQAAHVAAAHLNTAANAAAQRGSMATQFVPNASGRLVRENVVRVSSNQVDVHNSDGTVSSFFGDGSWRVSQGGSIIRSGGSDPHGNWTKLTGEPLRTQATPRASATAQQPAAPPRKGWYTQRAGDGYPHAYTTKNGKNLGIYVGNDRVVQPANGGRVWALYDIDFDGTLHFVGKYGRVGGAPPPPNAAENDVPAQFYPPPAPVVVGPPPAPTYVTAAPAPVFAAAPAPVFAAPQPAYVAAPAPVYALPPPPPPPPAGVALVPWQSTSPDGQWIWSGTGWVQNPYLVQAAPPPPPAIPQVAGVPAYDPTAAALYAGAAYGAEAAAAAAPPQQQQMDPITASIMMGGGITDMGGDFSGMVGGFDPNTLALLGGGSADAATMMALENGGYDPTMGGLY